MKKRARGTKKAYRGRGTGVLGLNLPLARPRIPEQRVTDVLGHFPDFSIDIATSPVTSQE